MQYVASALSFAAAVVAIIGGARDGRLSATSWAALVVAAGSLIASLVITQRTQRELGEWIRSLGRFGPAIADGRGGQARTS